MSTIEQGKINDAAMIAHEANRAYCLTIGDSSHVDWRSSPEWLREGVIRGAQAIAENPALTPEESHEKWLADREAAGWVYGPVKDVEKKTHPNLVPYDELRPEQRVKDALFGAVVRAVLGVPAPGILATHDLVPAIDFHRALIDLDEAGHQLETAQAEIQHLREQLGVSATAAVEAPSETEPTESEGAEA